jgi:DNA (cytosine-5)-methyltransferase 1
MNLNYVDLFSGAGGMGDGFHSAGYDPVYINDSDPWAIKTIQLRKAYWELKNSNNIDLYYDYIESKLESFPSFYDPTEFLKSNKNLAYIVDSLASSIELNKSNISDHYSNINNNLNDMEHNDVDVIAGGPPCQAYSYTARSRFSKINDNTWGSKKENKKRRKQLNYDKRHQLYELYLELIKKCQPKAFVYENVPGLLTAKSKKENSPGPPSYVINRLRNDFSSLNGKYNIIPLGEIDSGSSKDLNFKDFIVNAADYGVPQNRKRFIMIGFRTDIVHDNNAIEKFWKSIKEKKNKCKKGLSVEDAIRDFPHIQHNDGDELYRKIPGKKRPCSYGRSMRDNNLKYILNYSSRSHMQSDLDRYKWYADFALKNNRNATLKDLPQELYPNHESAKILLNGNINGKEIHIDRFRVKLWGAPSTTITAHISKDGHAHIHPDPEQNRSLTVREAARIQSFPDNYAFCGPRTAQFKHVGNAVPPLFASAIAESIKKAIT